MKRSEVVQKLVDMVEDWDLKMLIESAQDAEEQALNGMPDEELLIYWNAQCKDEDSIEGFDSE